MHFSGKASRPNQRFYTGLNPALLPGYEPFYLDYCDLNGDGEISDPDKAACRRIERKLKNKCDRRFCKDPVIGGLGE